MVACVVLVLAQTANFGKVVVFDPKTEAYRQEVRATVLTEDEVVAGFYCANRIDHHGDTSNSKPFVWEDGTLHWLPLGKANYGRVFAGNSKVLVGEVQTDTGTYPAKWTPDPRLRWAKATIARIGKDLGYAVAIANNGDIWVKQALDFARFPSSGNATRVRLDKFDIVGCDGQNRPWGNSYGTLGYANTRNGQAASVIDGTKAVEVSKLHVIRGVNARGDWCGMLKGVQDTSGAGTVVTAPIACRGGKIEAISLPKFLSADATDINDSGAVIGHLTIGTDTSDRSKGDPYRTYGYVLRESKLLQIPDPLPEEPGFYPARINNGGAIVGRTSGLRPRIFLLRPR